MKTSMTGRGIAVAVLALLAASSCVDEEIVFRDRVLFEEPLEEAQGFLGYTDRDTKLTVCGNCHVGQQLGWIETAHADAWDGLQSSDHAQEFCEGCHSVNELGNPIDVLAGYNATKEERYEDVQCESCHGPALNHVQNPDSDPAKPLAPLEVGLDLTLGCGECHSGTHHPFVEEWSNSAHAEPWGEFFPGGVNAGAAAAFRAECAACHQGVGALESFGEDAVFLEQDSDELLPHTCAVCHDPHAAKNEGQLRFSVSAPSVEENLCARCHDRRTSPDPNSSHGLEPHSPSAALLLGEAGWFPDGAEVDVGLIIGTHGSEGNERLCATCHVSSFTIFDDDRQENVFSVGHTFQAIPCVDDSGLPTGGDCALNATERSFEGCVAAGCHTSAQGAFGLLLSKTGDIEFFAEELEELLLQVDPNLDGAGGFIDARNPEFTIAEGAFFNLELAKFGGTGRPSDRLAFASAAAHNPFLVPELLRASIEAVEERYADIITTPAPSSIKGLPYKTLKWK